MKDLLLVVLALIAVFSLTLNVLLICKVNYLRAARRSDKKLAQTLIKSAVNAACESQNNVATKEDINRVLEQQLDIARDVVERLENKIIGYQQDIQAASYIQNKLYELLSQKRIIKNVWSRNDIEYYDINTMSIEEIHDMFGHPMTA